MSLTLLLTEPNDRNIISPSESDLPPLGQIFFSRLLLSEQQGLPPSQNFGFYMEDTNTGSGRRRAQLLAGSPDTCSYFSAAFCVGFHHLQLLVLDEGGILQTSAFKPQHFWSVVFMAPKAKYKFAHY